MDPWLFPAAVIPDQKFRWLRRNPSCQYAQRVRHDRRVRHWSSSACKQRFRLARKSRVKEGDEPELGLHLLSCISLLQPKQSRSCCVKLLTPSAVGKLYPEWAPETGGRRRRKCREEGTMAWYRMHSRGAPKLGTSKESAQSKACRKMLWCCGGFQIPRIFSSLVPSYLPSPTPSAPALHPPALYAPPQKSSDSWKVLGVYSVTTKQNHLKTKWAGECAGAIRPVCLCGHREKRPLRIKGMDGRSGKRRGAGGTRAPHHLNPQLIPPRPIFNQGRLSALHTPRLLSAPIKGEHVICLCYSPCMNKIPSFCFSLIYITP